MKTYTNNDLEYIAHIIDIAHGLNLLPEIFYSAIKHMKENPQSSIEAAIQASLNEWDITE